MIKYTGISIISEKIKVIIIGGGRAAYIKAKTFINSGCKIYVLSKDVIKEFQNLKKDITYIKESMKKAYIRQAYCSNSFRWWQYFKTNN